MKTKIVLFVVYFFQIVTLILLSKVYAFSQENQNTVIDVDGNVYKIVKIGSQVWMAENLKTTRYSNGELIEQSINDEDAPKYYIAYAEDESNIKIYGLLYSWFAATDKRNICPTGWHLPTWGEWSTLGDYLFGYEVAGNLLKERGNLNWKQSNSKATNCSGFTALPGGKKQKRQFSKNFQDIEYCGYWWYSSPSSMYAMLSSSSSILELENFCIKGDDMALSIRCVRDN